MAERFMKTLKILFLTILSLFVTIYLAFLFILPHSIDLNKYAPQIKKEIQNKTGFQVELEGLKVKTTWNLSAGALINKADLMYSNGEKFAQINGLQVRLSLLPLFFNKIQINKIEADKVLADIDISKQETVNNTHDKTSFSTSTFHISPKMPDIKIKKYRVTFLKGANKYSLKGSDLKVSDFSLNKSIKISAIGEVILNKRKQISYNFSVFSKDFPQTKASGNISENINSAIKIFEDLYKYNINGNINANLAINNKNNDINGNINIDKLSFTVGNVIYPQSTLKLDFKGDKAKINSSFHVDKNSKAIISGIFKTGKHKYIDLQVKSDKINIKDILLIAKAMSKTLGQNKLQNINAEGILKADFNLKSDFKKVESNGYLRLKNANITNKLYNVSLNSVNADIDFSQSSLQIKQANANLNDQPITIKGNIDKNANANISILANDLQLKGVLLTLGKTSLINENDIQGLVNVKAALKGHLDKTTPKINATISNVNIKNKKTKTKINLANIIINSDAKSIKTGKINLLGLNIHPNPTTIISAPKINLNFNEKNLNIEKTYLYINNIKTNLLGAISDINSTPKLNSINISIPNQISVPIKGYAGSNALIKGDLAISGDLNNPQIKGGISIPSAFLPSVSTSLKNMTIQFDKNINVNCPQVQIANSLISINTQIDNNFSNGIVARNVNFKANLIDLNSLIPIYKKLPKNSSSNFTIANGKCSIGQFKTAGMDLSNITSNISLKNNILKLDKLLADAYFGKIGGSTKYDLKNEKTYLQLQGRGLNAKSAIAGLIGRDDDINGKLDFDSNLTINGSSQAEILHSLKGYTNFIISNGRMGVLGEFEHLIYAQNILSNNVFKATLNVIAKAVTVKNTGVYRYMKGKMTFNNGWANIEWLKTSGPSMSLYITGRYYLPDNTASLILLGRISDDVVRVLGPIGEFSMDQAISYIPKIGDITAFFANQFTTNPSYENTSQIPYLTPKTEFHTKEFKVVIDGDTQSQNSIKSFKWLSRPKIKSLQEQNIPAEKQQVPPIPDFVKKLPDLQSKD